MTWQLAVFLRIIVGYAFGQYLLKALSIQGRRTERIFWMFICTFAIALALAAFTGIAWSGAMAVIFALGVVNAGAVLYQWKATAISQSRTALFTFWDDAIAIGLSFFIFHEATAINAFSVVGIGLSALSLFLFIRQSWKKKVGVGEAMPSAFYGYIAIYSAIWGFAIFAQRFWAVENLPTVSFLVAWYAGALLGASVIKRFYHDPDPAQQKGPSLTLRDKAATTLLACCALGSMAFAILSYQAPQIIVQPIYLVAEMVIPAPIGLFLFHERKQYDRAQWIYFAIGAIGALLLIFGH